MIDDLTQELAALASMRAARLSRNRDLKLSILMPVYNEDATIIEAVEMVLEQPYPCPIELVVVDDGSSVPVEQRLRHLRDERLGIFRHAVNLGKGAALRQAAALATGTHIVPFDADLEYDAMDLVPMLAPVLQGRCEVVYGTRMFGVNTRFQSYSHGMGNRLLTLAANMTFDAYISDLHTCLKLMPLDLFRGFPLRESGFGLDTEITALILRSGLRPFEVPISYHSRSKAEGKKITWRDGVESLRILGRVRRAPQAVAPSCPIAPAEPSPAFAEVNLPSRSRRTKTSARSRGSGRMLVS